MSTIVPFSRKVEWINELTSLYSDYGKNLKPSGLWGLVALIDVIQSSGRASVVWLTEVTTGWLALHCTRFSCIGVVAHLA